jgi:uncharacterized protein (TIGR00255 family)
MPIQSMTGYARVSGSDGAVVEAKSVNGRGLDVRMRVPPGLDALEQPVRALALGRFKRGSLSITLTLPQADSGAVAINHDYLDAVLALRETVSTRIPLAPSTIEGLLALRGMTGDSTGSQSHDVGELSGLCAAALDALSIMRASEGAAIAEVIRRQVNEIATLAARAAADPNLTQEAIAARLAAQLQLVMASGIEMDAQRLAAEAALLATRCDIREEVDRLAMHCASIMGLLDSGDGVGRKLDFLAQELNREANTLCSKSNAASLTAIGLDLKVLIDQFREQAQNVE